MLVFQTIPRMSRNYSSGAKAQEGSQKSLFIAKEADVRGAPIGVHAFGRIDATDTSRRRMIQGDLHGTEWLSSAISYIHRVSS